MAPPLGLTFSSETPSAPVDTMPTAANASLISMTSRSSTVSPSLSSAFLMAFDGCSCSEVSGPGHDTMRADLGQPGRPSSSALALLITTTAAAPSEIWDAEPAVIVPSLVNAGRSRDSVSTVVSGRMPSSSEKTIGSPLRCGISTGTISSANTPFFCASAARW